VAKTEQLLIAPRQGTPGSSATDGKPANLETMTVVDVGQPVGTDGLYEWTEVSRGSFTGGSNSSPDASTEAVNSTRSHRTNWSSHKAPYAPKLAHSTAAVWTRREELVVAPAATRTAMLDAISPTNESVQYGRAWRRREREFDCDHTHLRFSSKDGMVPIAVAMTFDHTAEKPPTPTRTPRTDKEVAVDMAETDP
jgi:hypothetical protein